MAATINELKLLIARVEHSFDLADMVRIVKRFYGPEAHSAIANVDDYYDDETTTLRVYGFDVYDAEGKPLERKEAPVSEEDFAAMREYYEDMSVRMPDYTQKYYPTFEVFQEKSDWWEDLEYQERKYLSPDVANFGLVTLDGDLTPPDLSKLTLVWDN